MLKLESIIGALIYGYMSNQYHGVFYGRARNFSNQLAQAYDKVFEEFDLTGHPSISVPCKDVKRMPVGLMITGRHFEDATVLRAAHAYEQAR